MRAETATFHKMLAGCIQRDVQSWQLFVSSYGALAQRLIHRHFDSLEQHLVALLKGLFQSIHENGCAVLKAFDASSEREFAVPFRQHVFQIARHRLNSKQRPIAAQFKDLEEYFKKVPLFQQEIAWLALLAFADEEICQILRMPIALVKTVRDEILGGLAKQMGQTQAESPHLQQSLLIQVEGGRTQSCPDVKSLCNLMDGRLPWHEKRAMESHVSECLFCLNRVVGLKESAFHLKALTPLSWELTGTVLRHLSLIDESTTAKRGFLARAMKVFASHGDS